MNRLFKKTTLGLICLVGIGLNGAAKAQNATPPASGLMEDQFSLKTADYVQYFQFRAHVEGLTNNQIRALEQVAQKADWAQDAPYTIRLITNNTPQSLAFSDEIKSYLLAHGVSSATISGLSLNEQPNDIVKLELVHTAMLPITCGLWPKNLAESRDNQASANYGCAITANIAAQINDPRVINRPRSDGNSNAAHSVLTIKKYETGQLKDVQASVKSQ